MSEEIKDGEEITTSIKLINVEFFPGFIEDWHAKVDAFGKVIAFVDENGEDKMGIFTLDNLSFDDDKLDDLMNLFQQLNIEIFNEVAATVEDQDDYLGSFDFSWKSLNLAITSGKLVFYKDIPTGIYTADILYNF